MRSYFMRALLVAGAHGRPLSAQMVVSLTRSGIAVAGEATSAARSRSGRVDFIVARGRGRAGALLRVACACLSLAEV